MLTPSYCQVGHSLSNRLRGCRHTETLTRSSGLFFKFAVAIRFHHYMLFVSIEMMAYSHSVVFSRTVSSPSTICSSRSLSLASRWSAVSWPNSFVVMPLNENVRMVCTQRERERERERESGVSVTVKVEANLMGKVYFSLSLNTILVVVTKGSTYFGVEVRNGVFI